MLLVPRARLVLRVIREIRESQVSIVLPCQFVVQSKFDLNFEFKFEGVIHTKNVVHAVHIVCFKTAYGCRFAHAVLACISKKKQVEVTPHETLLCITVFRI